MGRFVTIDVDGSTMDAYVAEPAGAGPFPAVLEMHHRDGVETFTKTFCDNLAARGYIAIAPNLFHRMPPGENPHNYRKFLTDPTLLRDIDGLLTYLGGRSDVHGDRLGLIGHCMGGHVAWIGGLTIPAFRALVVYYGGDVQRAWQDGAAPIDLVPNASCPILGFFGKEDQNPSPADMAALSAALRQHGKPHEFHAYDGAGHAFQNFIYPERYHRHASEDSWSKTVAFLDHELQMTT